MLGLLWDPGFSFTCSSHTHMPLSLLQFWSCLLPLDSSCGFWASGVAQMQHLLFYFIPIGLWPASVLGHTRLVLTSSQGTLQESTLSFSFITRASVLTADSGLAPLCAKLGWGEVRKFFQWWCLCWKLCCDFSLESFFRALIQPSVVYSDLKSLAFGNQFEFG